MAGPWVADPAVDPSSLRHVYGSFPSGVVAVCGRGPAGLAASSFTSVSMDPPLVSFCIQGTSRTWPTLAGLPRLGVSVLGAAHVSACLQLSARDADRFAGLAVTTTADGAVFVDGTPAQLDCTIEGLLPAGDHDVVLLRVLRARVAPGGEPLAFHAGAFRVLGSRTSCGDGPS
ncbi:MAG: hypothetical protein ABS81_06750 [Pseudonocardia sp. SCN 72-86]|nr:MAG: hypothetical protein ABS81_06750 [Pseudonocardia sp. SCN 72-86]